jgi:hypothetical protein
VSECHYAWAKEGGGGSEAEAVAKETAETFLLGRFPFWDMGRFPFWVLGFGFSSSDFLGVVFVSFTVSAFLVVLFVPLALLFRRHPTRPSIYGADTALFKGDYFPDYQGGDNYDAACDYLLHRFVSLNQSAATKQIYAHYTCATDTQQIKCAYSFPISSLPLHRPSADADSPL